MKYNEQVFRDMADSEKAETVYNELHLETHNATTKADLLMMLEWMYGEYIFGKQHAKDRWIPVGERLPENEKEVEVSIERRLENGTRRLTCRAIYEDGSIWSENSRFSWNDFDGLDSDLEYSKELDDWKVPQGWFEAATYAEEFAAIGDFVVAWRPLPEPYAVENNQQKKCPFLGFDGHAICFSEGECQQEYLADCPVYVPTD